MTNLCINTKSNHPRNIIKKLPESIEQRINNISSDATTFDNVAPFYNEALKSSGYKHNIQFREKKSVQRKNKNRKCNIIWYNPPYSMGMKTNIAKVFLSLIDKLFP